jgi:hypothetical protein
MTTCDSSYDMFYVGRRMSLHLPRGVVSHEVNDTGGIMYFTDGTRTSWRRADRRMSCPDWRPYHLANWNLS